jgi:DNA polymerase-3 subunit psi
MRHYHKNCVNQRISIKSYLVRNPQYMLKSNMTRHTTGAKIVVVSKKPTKLHDPLVLDMLRVLNIKVSQVTLLTYCQYKTLASFPESLCKWLLDIDDECFPGLTLKSPNLDELARDMLAKRDLWQQICHHNLASPNFLALSDSSLTTL